MGGLGRRAGGGVVQEAATGGGEEMRRAAEQQVPSSGAGGDDCGRVGDAGGHETKPRCPAAGRGHLPGAGSQPRHPAPGLRLPPPLPRPSYH